MVSKNKVTTFSSPYNLQLEALEGEDDHPRRPGIWALCL